MDLKENIFKRATNQILLNSIAVVLLFYAWHVDSLKFLRPPSNHQHQSVHYNQVKGCSCNTSY